MDRAPERLPARELDPDALVHIGFTSGTTGEPKGVMNTHQTLDAVARGWVGHVGAETFGDPLVNFVPSPVGHHTGFLWGVLLSALLQGTAVYVNRWEPGRAVAQMREVGATFMIGAPTFLLDIMNLEEADRALPQTLSMVAMAGAPVPRTLVPLARERLGCFICPAWGMTEHGLGCSAAPGQPLDMIDGTDGTMIGGCRLRTTESRQETPAGVEGDLEMTGPGLFLGYFDRPDFTAADFDGVWFRTGDRAVISADGFVTLRGRSKDIVIRGGENIPVVDVESIVHLHPEIVDVAIVGAPDPRLGERAVAFVVPRTGGSAPTLPELVEFLLDKGLSKHFLPERMESVDDLPKTPSGKVRKVELRERLVRDGAEV
jgi:cyclohexanecarboxylate-CoA ligase